ncbi:Rieske 2Fe-2S domain-containing protein [Actinomadura sp. LOL_016]|uniref:Rieske 2Fe-2S domain-containing protein n=1 Tax=unclassified Actinomadura TaxID=2626254 RepID=UPI003A7FA1CB
MRITKELNQRLTRVGPGTPMGDLFRRYWIPACLSEEVSEPDGAPARVRLLGEDLVAFRDSTGTVGLVDAYCPHRRAPMFFGRNEEAGLRCVYHGWKFDTVGACVDMPTEAEDSKFRFRVSIKSYPTYEAGGIVWTYMGPQELTPPVPDQEWMRAPQTHRRVSKTGESCNFLQAIEGGIDTAHSSFAHNNDLENPRLLRNLDRHPRLDVEFTDYGFRYASLRNVGNDTTYLRIYQYFMPSQQCRGFFVGLDGKQPELPGIFGHIWVPIDDEHTFVYNTLYSMDERFPITDEWWEEHEAEMGRGKEENIPGTYWLARNQSNDYLIDREVQRTKTFTGIEGVNTQDFAIQEGMGPVVDRSQEALGSTDRAIQACRRLLVRTMDEIERGGTELAGHDSEAVAEVRGADALVPTGTDWRDEAKTMTLAHWR